MSSVEDRQNSENNGQRFSSGRLQTSGLISQLSPVEQILPQCGSPTDYNVSPRTAIPLCALPD